MIPSQKSLQQYTYSDSQYTESKYTHTDAKYIGSDSDPTAQEQSDPLAQSLTLSLRLKADFQLYVGSIQNRMQKPTHGIYRKSEFAIHCLFR